VTALVTADRYLTHAETCATCPKGPIAEVFVGDTCALGASYIALYHSYRLIEHAVDMQAALRAVSHRVPPEE